MQAKAVRVLERSNSAVRDGSAQRGDEPPLLAKSLRALVQALLREAKVEYKGREVGEQPLTSANHEKQVGQVTCLQQVE